MSTLPQEYVGRVGRREPHNDADLGAPPDRPVRSRVRRVLMVCPRFLPEVGGVEGHVYEVARRLVARGIEVTVLTTDRERVHSPRDRVEGIRVRRVAAWPRGQDYYLAPAILNEVRRIRCDVMHLHSHHTFVAPLAMAAALGRRLPFVVTFHGLGHATRVRGPLRPLQVAVLGPLLGRARRLIALTNNERDLFRGLLRLPTERFVVIPSGGDRLVPARTAAGSSSHWPTIVSIGRLERYKGQHRLIAALPRVVEQYPDARLLFIGAGSEEERLRRMAATAGVGERVDVVSVPYTDAGAMAALLQRASLVALLGEREGQPLAMLEAAALGRPLLVSEVPGLQELIDAHLAAGISLPASSDEVAEAVIRQLRKPLLPNSGSVSTWDSCVDRLIDVYASVSGGRAAQRSGRL